MKKEKKDFEPKFYFVEGVFKDSTPDFKPIKIQLPEQKEADPDFYICSKMRGDK